MKFKNLFLYPICLYQKSTFIKQAFLPPKLFLEEKNLQTGMCRFTPTCSQYTFEAIGKYGIVKGVFLGIKRILKCHPWSKGGIDPLPNL